MPEKDVLWYQRAQIHLSCPSAERMWLVSLCAGLAIFQSSLSDSFASLFIALSTVLAAVLTEFLFYFRTEKAGMVRDGSSVASALVLALLLPNNLHPIYAVMGGVFAMAVVKHSFGGLGSNWMNPAIGGWLFIRCSWPDTFNKALEMSPLAIVSAGMGQGLLDPSGSPLEILHLAEAGYFSSPAGSLEWMVQSFLNSRLFSIIGIELPDGYIEFFNSSGIGIIADRGVFALLLGTIIITASQISRSWVPAVYLGVYGLLIRLFGALPFGGALGNGDIFFGFFSGGTMVAAFLLIADPATGPKSNWGALLMAAGAGGLTFIFRYHGLEAYGAFVAVGMINALVPLMRDMESRRFYETGSTV
ncbi:MAG: RnfABCDGE type electron transport complex subunit D [Treponema sp.]|jgi:electron transport complex protein RnfD|nr:RnfABCDGE type electron transport complex subunit D [Treponema sp.]